MTRRAVLRVAHLALLFVVAGFFLVLGVEDGNIVDFASLLFGLIFALFGVAGVCGFNIWHGKALDHDKDPFPEKRVDPIEKPRGRELR